MEAGGKEERRKQTKVKGESFQLSTWRDERKLGQVYVKKVNPP